MLLIWSCDVFQTESISKLSRTAQSVLAPALSNCISACWEQSGLEKVTQIPLCSVLINANTDSSVRWTYHEQQEWSLSIITASGSYYYYYRALHTSYSLLLLEYNSMSSNMAVYGNILDRWHWFAMMLFAAGNSAKGKLGKPSAIFHVFHAACLISAKVNYASTLVINTP